VAVHEGLPVNPVTVKTAGVDSEADAVAGVSVPLAQTKDTVTDPPAFGWKSLLTVKVALLRVLTIVQEPVVSGAEQVPDEE
jgi:hypothetical protein